MIQTECLRGAVAAREATHADERIVQKLEQVRKAFQGQEYQRLDEQNDLVRCTHREHGWRDIVNRRYRGG